jgi:hypothetical protein
MLGLAWLGLAWLGLAWLGLAWLGLAWLGLAWLGDDCDEPAPRVAGFNFHDRADQTGDGRSLYGNCCFLAAMLIIAAASRISNRSYQMFAC